MNLRKIDKFQMDESIRLALKEDITSEDISTNAIYKNSRLAEISLYSKEEGILAGIDVFKRVFELLDDNVEFIEYKKDGDKLLNKDLILKIKADVKTILSAERTALNYLQRMSGIATYTRKMLEALDDENIKLLDTRKTTPNMRIFEKYSVKVGGGYNHRYNLSDAIMLKDNHIDAAGSITEAIKLAREYSPFIKKIEIEVEDLKGVEEAVKAGADIIMLDNMDIETTKRLSNKYNIPHYDLDNIYWDNSSQKYGIKTEVEKRDKLLLNILEKDDWIIEGIYYKWLEKSFKDADIIYILDLPKYIYKFRIIKRFIKRKLKLETGKKETLKSLLDLLKWTDKFQNEDMKEIIKILEKYKEKVYFIKSKKEINKILEF